MRIQYEKGDWVFERSDFGGNSYEIIRVHEDGVTVCNLSGRTWYLGKHEIEPSRWQVQGATWIPPEDPDA